MYSFSLSDLSLEDLFLHNHLQEYKPTFDVKSTIGDNIYEYVTSKKGFIHHERNVYYSKEKEQNYRQSLRDTVAKGSPITFFFSSFSPKIPNPSITNHQLLPDMADLLTLVHLHLVAKQIRSFYDYGFRFIIAFKGRLHQPIMNWDNDIVESSYHILQDLIGHAERITGVRHVIELVDYMDLVQKEGDYFQTQWKQEIQQVKHLYHKEDAYIERKIKDLVKDYNQSVEIETNKDTFFLEQAFSIRALKQIQFRGGEKNVGICNSLPATIRTSVRGLDPKLSLQINPYFRFYSYQRLLALSEKNEWFTFKWKEEQNMIPVCTTEYEYPFYYKTKP